MSLAHALDGIRVLDLSRLLPGPFLTMILADMGADVVKVEDPRVGDYLRAFPPGKGGLSGRFLAVNRGKRSLALDLKDAKGRDAFLRMAEQADVIVESFRPGVMDRLGVGYDALAARNPKIVVCSISGYGASGPYVEKAGHDLNYIALAGVLAMTAESRGRMPAMPGVQIADMAGGGLWGATSVLAALVQRDRTGRGAHLDVSMTEGALALILAELGNLDCGARPTRGAETLNGALACYGVYRCKDDRYLSVGALEPKFYLAFNEAIGRKGSIAEIAGDAHVQEKVRGEIAAILASKTREEWLPILAKHDCCCEPVLELEEVVSHPQHVARNVFFTIDGGALGSITQVRTPVGTPANPTIPPRLGEQSRAVLAEYGFDSDEIAALVSG
ncbi:MAG TPA: CaiB/BaiF CoA-transferase family protein [Kofleriaceae bacterium]|nr:CaiB/BaiF CoA-transferase family protein [Kofleriaceae bacterium]